MEGGRKRDGGREEEGGREGGGGMEGGRRRDGGREEEGWREGGGGGREEEGNYESGVGLKPCSFYLRVEVEESLRAVDVVEGSEGSGGPVDKHGVHVECSPLGHEEPVGIGTTHEHLCRGTALGATTNIMILHTPLTPEYPAMSLKTLNLGQNL